MDPQLPLHEEVRREQLEVYCDIEWSRMNRGTLPTDILVTASRPDLVLIYSEDNRSECVVPVYGGLLLVDHVFP